MAAAHCRFDRFHSCSSPVSIRWVQASAQLAWRADVTYQSLKRMPRRAWLKLLGVAMLPWASGASGASAQSEVGTAALTNLPSGRSSDDKPGAVFAFDIPAQPLDGALNQYAGITGQPAVFRSSLVAGRTASPVRGMLTAKEALQAMLGGTGLEVERVHAGGVDAFVLRLTDMGDVASLAPYAASPAVPAGSGWTEYDARVQQSVWQMLCTNPLTASGDYRALLRFRIDEAGKLGQAQLLTSTGQPRRDAILLQLMQRVRVGAPPPPDLAQPITLLLLPRGATSGGRCSSSAGTRKERP
jgi:TonB family protein